MLSERVGDLRFTFAIDEIDPTGEAKEKIAGANNVCPRQPMRNTFAI